MNERPQRCSIDVPRARILASLILALSIPSAVAAGDEASAPPDLTGLSIDQLLAIDVVYGASKYEQKVTQAPSSVTIVTADEIRRFGYATLADILGSVRGFYSVYDRSYSYIGIRGFQRPGDYNLRTLLLVDGHRINDNIYNSALMGTESILNVDDIERVEVIRGPSSSIYGAGAFFAVVNVVTRSGRDLHGTELSAGAGGYGTHAARAAYGKGLAGGGDILLSGSAYRSAGQDLFYKEFDDPAENNGLAVNADEDGFYKFISKASFRSLKIEAASSTRDKGMPTAAFGTVFDDPRNRTTDRRSFLDIAYTPALGPKATFLGRVYYDRYFYQGKYLFGPPRSAPPENLYVERAYAYTYGAEAQLTLKSGERNTLVSGGEYRDHSRQDFYAFDASGLFGVYSDLRRTSDDWGLFVEDELVASKRLSFDLGARYDQYPSVGGSTNPRLALICAATDAMTLKVLAGGAFRAPSVYELYYGGAANPALKPETIHTLELVLEQYLGKSFRLTGSVFSNRINDLISYDPATLLFQNLDEVDSRGLEVELQKRWLGGRSVEFDYALQNTTNRIDGSRLTDSPRNLAHLHLLLPLAGERLSAGAELQYVGPRLTLGGDELGGFVLTNVTFLSANLAPGLGLSAGVYNLFDKLYSDPGSRGDTQDAIEQDGRHVRFKLTWKF